MTLERAILLQQLIVHQGEGNFDDDDIDALKLLIEAGKAVVTNRIEWGSRGIGILPGETEE